MSNVLIGIIGVILFIGLALAGALFLGPRFQESAANSKASAAMQVASQTAAAYNLYVLQSGDTSHGSGGVASGDVLYTGGYLKEGLGSSYVTGVPILMDSAGSGGLSTNSPAAVALVLGSDASSKKVCEAVERQTGRISSTQPFDASTRSFASASLVGNAGCQYNGNSYVVFNKL